MLLTTFIYTFFSIDKKSLYTNEKCVSGILTNISLSESYKLTIKNKEAFTVYTKNNNYNIGDSLKICGSKNTYGSNTNFNLFNYKKYMLSKKSYYYYYNPKIKLIKRNKNIFFKIKKGIIDNIGDNTYLNTFILGDNSYIDKHVKQSYRINGISHLFSVSGMHVTLLTTIILFILNKIKKTKLNYLVVIIVLIYFMFLTSFTPSVIRAVLLFIFLYINKLFKLNIPTYKILIFIAIVAILINPFNIYNVGFKFSYIISLYLILFNSIINRHKNYISKTFITSLISFFASIPILINNYYSINLMTVFNNIIFVPLVSLIIFPTSLVVLLIPSARIIFDKLIYILESLSLFLAKFKIEVFFHKIPIFFIILYFVVITFVLYMIKNKKYKYTSILLFIALLHTNYNNIFKQSYITFIDVSQGDSALIHINKENILIDTGGNVNKSFSEDIITYLKSEGISKLDYLVLTHGDYDHMGEAINLVNNFKVENVFFNCGEFNDLENNLIKTLKKKKIKYYSCIKELKIDKYKINFLNTKVYDNENDNSSVIYLNYKNYKFLFMGDAGIKKEKDILEKYNLKNIDVLKIGHHGSKTSSSKIFIDETNPKYCVISVGKNNRYGHPNKEVLNNLNNSKIYRTDQDGSIMFKIRNNKLKIETCSP